MHRSLLLLMWLDNLTEIDIKYIINRIMFPGMFIHFMDLMNLMKTFI